MRCDVAGVRTRERVSVGLWGMELGGQKRSREAREEREAAVAPSSRTFSSIQFPQAGLCFAGGHGPMIQGVRIVAACGSGLVAPTPRLSTCQNQDVAIIGLHAFTHVLPDLLLQLGLTC